MAEQERTIRQEEAKAQCSLRIEFEELTVWKQDRPCGLNVSRDKRSLFGWLHCFVDISDL